MKINLLLSHLNYDELYFTNKTVIVIDVLRASSTIVAALQNGAKEIIPVASVEFAVKISGGLFGGHTLMGGERNTRKIDGFALGNSPIEYSSDIVKGKSVILYTTNGSRAAVKAKFSENLFVCSFLNLSSIANHLCELGIDIEILCAGRSNSLSLEDTVCGGRLISEIETIAGNVQLSDSAKAGLALNKTFGKDIVKMLKDTEHGKQLIENGFREDIEFCGRLNASNAIPYFSGSVIKLLPEKVKI